MTVIAGYSTYSLTVSFTFLHLSPNSSTKSFVIVRIFSVTSFVHLEAAVNSSSNLVAEA
jgi:hypothetical protein